VVGSAHPTSDFPVGIKPAEPTAKGMKVHTDHMFAQDWFPIQVKQMDKVGRPDIDAFEAVMHRDGMRAIHIGRQKRTRESQPGRTFRADPSLTLDIALRRKGQAVAARIEANDASTEIGGQSPP